MFFLRQIRNQCSFKTSSINFPANQPIFREWSPSYWICHFLFPNFDFKLVISDPENPYYRVSFKSSNVLYFGSPYLIYKFWILIRKQRPRKLLSTEFHRNHVTSCILVRHIEFLDFEFGFVISDLNSPRVQKFSQIKKLLAIGSAILDLPFWILQFWIWTHNQRLQKPQSTKFQVNWI